uniref:Enoyl reductase (ER) domain-containing protein n=1 Tax=Oryza punctata TaxID=4537 RepID=A0A0E0M311_ORYPU
MAKWLVIRHVEVPIPSPKKGEVLIKMEAVSVNPVDWKIQSGMVRPFLPWKFPSIPACDLAGEVAAIGDGVSGFKLGDKVIAINFPSGGGFAEYAVARPPEVSAAEGACLPRAAVTALQALRAAGAGLEDAPPKNVLVTAASGGVGHFAVQLARLGGHRVTATFGARNLALIVGELGANEALDYATPDGAALRSPSGRRYDAVVHCAPHSPWSVFDRVLAADAGGVVVDITPSPAAAATPLLHRKRLTPLIFSPNKTDMARQGKLKPVVDSCYALSDAPEAWAKSMGGHATGKVISFPLLSLSLLSLRVCALVSAMAAAAAPKTMRAVQYDKYGGGAEGLKHVEVPIPAPKEGEVLIKMEAASINPIDWKIQKGMLRLFLPKKFPFIPVGDLSGEVVELGGGVSGFKPGDKVVSMSFPNCGGLAEYAVAPASLTVARPPEVSAAEGASLPAAAGSALQQLKAAGVRFDAGAAAVDGPKNVLVTAASGGVGHYAVQLAKLAGLHVTATCGARNLGFVRDGLGADEVLDYKTPDGAALRSPSGKKYDAVAHCAPPAPWPVFKSVLADAGGVVVDLTPGVAATVRSFLHNVTFSKKRLVPLILMPKKEEMEWLVDMAKQGKLKTTIDSKYPLSRAEEAWAKSMEGHATGKIVVEMGGTE